MTGIRGPRSARQHGFTYVFVLAVLALMGAGLAVIGPRWADQAQREREQELLRVGLLYAQAIKSYRDASPGSVKQYPPTLDALLVDRRMVGTHRHLRSLYPDPIDPAQPWGLVLASDGSVRGVFSRSAAAPLRVEPLDLGIVRLAAARRYQEWQFAPEETPQQP
jgi:type II secretory pathway pseudopilin PulG